MYQRTHSKKALEQVVVDKGVEFDEDHKIENRYDDEDEVKRMHKDMEFTIRDVCFFWTFLVTFILLIVFFVIFLVEKKGCDFSNPGNSGCPDGIHCFSSGTCNCTNCFSTYQGSTLSQSSFWICISCVIVLSIILIFECTY